MAIAEHSAKRRRHAPINVWVLGLAGLTLVVSGCATPVGVQHVDIQTAYRIHTESALSVGQPSEPSKTVLRRLGVLDRFEEEPVAVLAELHGGLSSAGDDDRLFALAELSFLHAERTGDRAHFLASAVYAWTLLFPGDATGTRFQPSDPRLRLAYDLYNQAVAKGLARSRDGAHPSGSVPDGMGEVRLEPGARKLPFGTLQVTLDASGLSWGGYRLEHLIPTTTLEVRGLRNRYRNPGLGASLAASLTSGAASGKVVGSERFGPRTKVPVTALLRFEHARASLASGQVRGHLELYAADQASTVTVDGRERKPALRHGDRRVPPRRDLLRADPARPGPGRPLHAPPVPARADPRGAGPRDGIEPRALGRADQRARRRSADPRTVPDLDLSIRHR